ncbi:defensin [Artemisia annua]|uniref:Defensin n=1 Tax=Artemisia annua TaxID=35608 RepID=A0A2U1P9Y1_ARTAN|nr:defensin [Artemisia annua]
MSKVQREAESLKKWLDDKEAEQQKISASSTNDNACHPPTHLKGLHNNVNSNGATSMEGTYDNASQPPASNYEPTKITTQQHHKKDRLCLGLSMVSTRGNKIVRQKRETCEQVFKALLRDCDLEGELCEKASKTWAGICGKTNHCSDQCKSWENAAHEACHTRAGKHIATSNVLEPQICLKVK